MGDSFELVLADEHVMFLDGLSAVLTQLGHRVLAAVTTQVALRDSVRAFQPEMVVTELRLKDGGDIEKITESVERSPGTKVVVLTSDPDPNALHAALSAGASGYVHKTRNIVVLLDLLARVAAGDVVIEASFTRAPADHAAAPPDLQRLVEYLTRRELECLALLTAGQDTAAMSKTLGVSTTTVRSHVQAVLTKLGVHSRLEAASLAARYQLVPVPPVEGSTGLAVAAPAPTRQLAAAHPVGSLDRRGMAQAAGMGRQPFRRIVHQAR